jgi:hypothetical protein
MLSGASAFLSSSGYLIKVLFLQCRLLSKAPRKRVKFRFNLTVFNNKILNTVRQIPFKKSKLFQFNFPLANSSLNLPTHK